ncbi:MAG: 5-formyltetrahydrofolate cyclo-ligase [Bacteroidetes bacterium]|nr:5-formyltetrahydrofolate cyclo-ligase [Bacteroidota bacterium]
MSDTNDASPQSPASALAGDVIAAAKADLRITAAKTRAALAKTADVTHLEAAHAIAAHAALIAGLAEDGVVAAYLPIRSELSPLPLISALARMGLVTAMPVTPLPGNPLVFHQWAPGDPLVDGPYNTLQPPIDDGTQKMVRHPVVIPRVILAPMLAFDHKCWRLGYGGGFYDRTIAGMRKAGHAVTAIGIAYDGQRVDRVPVGPFDVALDAVLTPGDLHHPDFDSADSGEV